VTARARSRGPNSTTATKLLPDVPYHLTVPGLGEEPNEASEPQRAEANGTGMLGAVSLNCSSMAGEMRWKRFTSPHGTCHRPNCR